MQQTITTKIANIKTYLRTRLKDQLSQSKITVQLCLLAVVFSVLASAVIVLFRLLIEWANNATQTTNLDFTVISYDWRVLLPLFGAFFIWIFAKLGSKRYKRMGIAYVLHKVKIYYGKIPLASIPAQFFQAFFALAGNFSVGKEGPAVHLGAACASILAERFQLPNNSVRIMCASGIAAGIAAIYNAPLAAVIFVFEVILREYKIHYFFPIMIAAICGTLSSRLFFGDVHEFEAIQVIHIPLDHYPLLAVGGLILGCVAAAFNYGLLFVTARHQHKPLYQRLLLAGIVTTLIGLIYPQALGSSDLAIDHVLSQNPGLILLLGLLVAKAIATIAAIGLGVPGGLIGPLYGLGAIIGAILSMAIASIFPSTAPFIGLYTVIGMTAMMGVCLSAPLAALVALLELTNDASIILPAMFVSIPAYLLAYQTFKTKPIFLQQLTIMGLEYKVPVVELGLQKIGVRAVMNRNFVVVNQQPQLLLEVMKRAEGRPVLFRNKQHEIEMVQLAMHNNDNASSLSHHKIEGVSDNMTLCEVYRLLAPTRTGEVYVYQDSTDNIIGVIGWRDLYQQIRQAQE
ncbi:chloride channel protein [Shewanella marina]|uniref:chloride channel protein n=1 Tax=Shewanella marina TaxID=487319 RepID=UPI0004722A77|nr:chloride channel protein [Shewanella marina]